MATARLVNALAACAVTLSLAGCADNETGDYASFGPRGWAYGDTVTVCPNDSATRFADIAVAIRHANDYEYSNIWVEVTYDSADTTVRDTFDIRLADVYGRWYGTGIGVGMQRVDTVARHVAINMGRPMHLRHIMRVDTLPGIEQAGLIVIK